MQHCDKGLTCLVWACTPPATSWPDDGSIPSWPEMYMERSTTTAWLQAEQDQGKIHQSMLANGLCSSVVHVQYSTLYNYGNVG